MNWTALRDAEGSISNLKEYFFSASHLPFTIFYFQIVCELCFEPTVVSTIRE